MEPLAITAFGMASALGHGVSPTLAAIEHGRSGLAPCRFESVDLPTHVGAIAGVDDVRLPADLARFDCRNNRAAELGLSLDRFAEAAQAAAARHGPARVGVFIGTSTAGILEAELAYRRRDPASGELPATFDYRHTHNNFSVADYVRRRLGLRGPCSAISTACSSSAKAFAAAARYIAAGVIDAAVVGGVDTLCLTTLYGFNSLDLLSTQPCRPYDVQRDGISIGEAAAFFLLERGSAELVLLGTGETSDAYHMSSPHPEGRGARDAMRMALSSAGLEPDRIDYVNLHGTGTPSNDAAEDKAMQSVFPHGVACNSTKGFTGHTLGAAGAVEALVSLLAIREGLLPPSPGTREIDPSLRAHYRARAERRRVSLAMSNSFGFGGTNCCLVFGRA